MAGNLFNFLGNFVKSKGNMSRDQVEGYANRPRPRAASALQKMGFKVPGMKDGGSVRGDGVSRVKTKGKMC